MRSRTVDIVISGMVGIAAGLVFLYAVEMTTNWIPGVELMKYPGDSPILVAGGSINVFTRGQWAAPNGTTGNDVSPYHATIGQNATTNTITLKDVVALQGTSTYQIPPVTTPWGIYLYARNANGTLDSGGQPNPGLILCHELNGDGNDCNYPATSAQSYTYAYLLATPAKGLTTPAGDFYHYNPGLNIDTPALDLKRYKNTRSIFVCNLANGDLCEHLGRIDIWIGDGKGGHTSYSYKCLYGLCRVRIYDN